MIGILCSDRKKREFVKWMHLLFKRLGKEDDTPIAIFKISDIDLDKMEVSAHLISAGKIKKIKTSLPPVIFNFSRQGNNKNIKKLRSMTELRNITLVNDVNRFDQSMIMEMLLPSKRAKKYVLPYHVYDKKERDFKPDDEQDYLIMPSKGASMSRLIYAKQNNGLRQVYGSQFFRKGHITDYIDASMCQRRWIFIDIPEIITHSYQPFVVRVYTQRGYDGSWSVIGEGVYPENIGSKYLDGTSEAALAAVNCISRLLPAMGVCFIDFVIDRDGNPYFLHFGGFDYEIIDQDHNNSFYRNFYRSLLGLADYYSHKQKED